MIKREKKIISYASGGLGNILLPISSCIAFAELTGRKPVICWEPIFRCMGTFHDLFENEIQVIKKSDLLNLENIKIYCDSIGYIENDSNLYSDSSFLQVTQKHPSLLPVSSLNINAEQENIILYHNNFLSQLDNEKSIKGLHSLIVKKEILRIVEEFVKMNNINKNVFGAHARATDFNNGIDSYLRSISSIIASNSEYKFFLCSDSTDWEEQIFNLFPNNIIIRKKKDVVTKLNQNNNNWSNNALTSKEAVIEGLIDMIILSKTNFTVYNEHSSFAQMVKYLI